MTMAELNTMMGADNAGYAVRILLENVKPDFIRACFSARHAQIENQLQQLQEDGIVYEVNGSRHVNWSKETDVYGDAPGAYWHATDQQHAEAESIRSKCEEADRLLYEGNRIRSIRIRYGWGV